MASSYRTKLANVLLYSFTSDIFGTKFGPVSALKAQENISFLRKSKEQFQECEEDDTYPWLSWLGSGLCCTSRKNKGARTDVAEAESHKPTSKFDLVTFDQTSDNSISSFMDFPDIARYSRTGTAVGSESKYIKDRMLEKPEQVEWLNILNRGFKKHVDEYLDLIKKRSESSSKEVVVTAATQSINNDMDSHNVTATVNRARDSDGNFAATVWKYSMMVVHYMFDTMLDKHLNQYTVLPGYDTEEEIFLNLGSVDKDLFKEIHDFISTMSSLESVSQDYDRKKKFSLKANNCGPGLEDRESIKSFKNDDESDESINQDGNVGEPGPSVGVTENLVKNRLLPFLIKSLRKKINFSASLKNYTDQAAKSVTSYYEQHLPEFHPIPLLNTFIDSESESNFDPESGYTTNKQEASANTYFTLTDPKKMQESKLAGLNDVDDPNSGVVSVGRSLIHFASYNFVAPPPTIIYGIPVPRFRAHKHVDKIVMSYEEESESGKKRSLGIIMMKKD